MQNEDQTHVVPPPGESAGPRPARSMTEPDDRPGMRPGLPLEPGLGLGLGLRPGDRPGLGLGPGDRPGLGLGWREDPGDVPSDLGLLDLRGQTAVLIVRFWWPTSYDKVVDQW